MFDTPRRGSLPRPPSPDSGLAGRARAAPPGGTAARAAALAGATTDFDDDLPEPSARAGGNVSAPAEPRVLTGAAERARELLLRTEWLDERLAAPSRMVARDLLEALDLLDAERSARLAALEARDRALAILERRAGEAAAGAAEA
jgi:hypothetical protein